MRARYNPRMTAQTEQSFTIGTGRGQVSVTWRVWRHDLHVHLGGGDDHVGAVAICGRSREGEVHLNVSAVPPHKEGPVAEEAARRLHEALGCNVAVSAGIHYDEITKQEIVAVVENARVGVGQLIARLRSERGGA